MYGTPKYGRNALLIKRVFFIFCQQILTVQNLCYDSNFKNVLKIASCKMTMTTFKIMFLWIKVALEILKLNNVHTVLPSMNET